MSLALPTLGKLDVAISIVGPSHRFTQPQRRALVPGTNARGSEFGRALTEAVDQLERELRTNGEDLTS